MSDYYQFPPLQCPKCNGKKFEPVTTRCPFVVCLKCGAFYRDPPVIKIKDAETVNNRRAKYMPGQDSCVSAGIADDDFVEIPHGKFLMGSPIDEEQRRDNELQHEVSVEAFKMLRAPVTVQQYQLFRKALGITSSDEYDPERQLLPVSVVFVEALVYADWLSEKTGISYRLPTEAEYEYACRAGTTTPYWTGHDMTTRQANFSASFSYGGGPGKDCRWQLTPVNFFPPNPWGLYDMNANGPEFCDSLYVADYDGQEQKRATADHLEFKRAIEKNRHNPAITKFNSKFRIVLRGGHWWSPKGDIRSAARSNGDCRSVSAGFRLVKDCGT